MRWTDILNQMVCKTLKSTTLTSLALWTPAETKTSVSPIIPPVVAERVSSSSYFSLEGKLCLASVALFSIYGGNLSKIDCENSFFLAGSFHFVHSLPLLFVHHTSRPPITKILFISAIILYSGSHYLKAYSYKINHEVYGSVGIWCAIFGWLSIVS